MSERFLSREAFRDADGPADGGTAISSALALANSRGMKAGLVVFVTDTESWADSPMRCSA